MVLWVLAGLWVGAGLYYWRSRSEGMESDSIGHFHHQLRAIERVGPVTIRPANRLVASSPADPADSGSAGDSGLAGASGFDAVGADGGASGFGSEPIPIARPLAATPLVAAGRRRQAFRRRRDVFFGLSLSIVGSLLLGVLPGLRPMWFLTLALTVLLGAYTVALINLRNRAAERSMKQAFAPRALVPEPALVMHGRRR